MDCQHGMWHGLLVLLIVTGLLFGMFPVPASAAPSGIPVLVLQNSNPWGFTSHVDVLTSLGYAPTVADWSQVGTGAGQVHMADFRFIYIPSVQPQSFYNTYAARSSELAAWVAGGGRLMFSVCYQSYNTLAALPGGVLTHQAYEGNNYIVTASHPIVTGELSDRIALTNADLVGDECSHVDVNTLPTGAVVILRDSVAPTLVEYTYGAGTVIASGLTWEFYSVNGSLGGTGSFARRAYDDLILYAFPKLTHTITASAGPGGTIQPKGDVRVLDGASTSFRVTADFGFMIAVVTVDDVPVQLTDTSVMTINLTNVTANHTIHATFASAALAAPVIELPDGLPRGAVGSHFSLHLLVTDDRSVADVGVYENGVHIAGSATGGDIRLPLTLADGVHSLVIVATDNAGHRTEQTIILSVDTMPPDLQVNALPSSVTSSTLMVSGSARDAVSGLAHFTINGEPVTPYLDGSFNEKLTLAKGLNTVVVEATDKVGNTTSQTFAVTYGTPSSSTPSSLYVLLKVGSKEMQVNGMPVALDAAPFIKDGRTLLPIRALIETLGGTVQWNAQTKTATVALGSRTMVLTVGSTKALVNGSPVTLDVAPMIVKGRTFLPLRAVAENLGLDLAWDAASQTISFTYWP